MKTNATKPKTATKSPTGAAGTAKRGRPAGTSTKAAQTDNDTKAKQGEGTSAPAEMRGGSKQVLITEAVISGRGGRPRGEEDYPFGMLQPARKVDGKIVGPSFFIPMTDSADGKLAVARKRYKAQGAVFWSRKVFEQVDGKGEPVEGLRIWRGSPELGAEVAR